MRSHAKASTAGSTQRQASRGFGAILRKGTLPLALLVAVLCLALGVASAVAVAPTISSTSVSAVTSKTAVLEASVNPEGEATTFQFQYGLADCSANPCTSTAIANVDSGTSAVKVIHQVEGLSPDTTYHYRVIASNGSGPIDGPDRIFTTYPAVAQEAACPNQAFRVGASANLPDCRAYEMVSPVDKGGGEIKTLCNIACTRTAFNQASFDGGKITYSAAAAFGDAVGGAYSSQYIAGRGADGWSSHGISPPHKAGLFPTLNSYADLEVSFKDFSDDLSSAWLYNSSLVPLTPDALAASTNIYRRDNLTDSYEVLTVNELAVPPILGKEFTVPQMQGHSADGEHALFIAGRPLTLNAAPGTKYQLYDFVNGKLHLVSVLPDGTASAQESWAGTLNGGSEYGATQGLHSLDNAISDDGSRVFWSTTSQSFGPGTIYVREHPAEAQSALNGSNECTEPAKACTREIGFGQYWTATPEGSKVLLSGDDPSVVGLDARILAIFDVDAETTTSVAGEALGVLGASDDLSHIYFVSKEALAAGATAGEPNLYLDQGGAKTFIATLAALDTGTGSEQYSVNSPRPRARGSRVTADGRRIAFASVRPLTGYDNTDAVNGEPDLEVYVYDADTQQLICASCNPSGARPVGKPLQKAYVVGNETPLEFGPRTAAAWLTTAENSLHTPNALSEDGSRLFFNSYDALVPRDTNGVQDVYQWEAQGSGSCQKASGCISLISTGQSPKKSEFVDATPDGSSVFIETSSSIDPRDPGLIDIYVARVNGGYPPPPAPPAPCVGDACQSAPAAPNDPTPASAGFRGAGSPIASKTRRRCRARNRQGAKHSGKAKQRKKAAKSCKRAKRGAGR